MPETKSVRIFIAYAREDAPLLEKLRRPLNVLQRQGLCEIFFDGEIKPGEQWDKRLKDELHRADIFLLLVTDDFLDSDYVNEVELPRALDLHRQGKARVLPVILRDCMWRFTQLSAFQAILKDDRPIEEVSGYAWAAQQVAEVLNDIQTQRAAIVEEKPVQAQRDADRFLQNDKKNDPFHDLMVFVKGGAFDMGSNEQESEEPIHRVTVPDFHICKYPVTQRQWKQIMGDNPAHFKGDDNHPVVLVSWDDVQQFIQTLNRVTNKRYRLPSEAEWEYAARGGNHSKGFKYAGSNNVDEVAWYSRNSGSTTHPVGEKKPNEIGLYDMSGNVYEWCEDVWHDNYEGAPTNGSAWTAGGHQDSRVLRGAAWNGNDYGCRSAYRARYYLPYRSDTYGFRLSQD